MKPPLPLPASEWAYFLDLDGSLIELANTPDAVSVGPELRQLLRHVHQACGGALALVSGRSLADLDKHLDMPGLPMAGQHGLEWRDAAGRVQRCASPSTEQQHIRRNLEAIQKRHPGLLLEDKGLALALHYRQAPALAGYVHRLLNRLVQEAGNGLYLQKGKRVVEVKPIGADKGTAIAAFMAEAPFHGRRPVFIGDDVTDESAFSKVNHLAGLSIKVGPGRTHASWRLPDVAAVRNWLAALHSTQRESDA